MVTLLYIRGPQTTLLQYTIQYKWKVVESIGTRGVLVLCHSIYVLKWMNGIKAQCIAGGLPV